MSTRWEKRDTPDIAITVFSNAEKVELYQNKKLVQTLDKPTDTINNVVWKFDPVPFSNGALAGNYDTFKAVGYRDGRVIGQHSATFTTTAGQDSK